MTYVKGCQVPPILIEGLVVKLRELLWLAAQLTNPVDAGSDHICGGWKEGEAYGLWY